MYEYARWDGQVLLDRPELPLSSPGEEGEVVLNQCQLLNVYKNKTGVRDVNGVNWPGWWGVTNWTFLVNGLLPDSLGSSELDYTVTPTPDKGPYCHRLVVNLDFMAEVYIRRLDWKPNFWCQSDWSEWVKTIEVHEAKHVDHVEASLVKVTRAWHPRVFEACANSDKAAGDALIKKMIAAYNADYEQLLRDNEAMRAALDMESLGDFDCSCPRGCITFILDIIKAVRDWFRG